MKMLCLVNPVSGSGAGRELLGRLRDLQKQGDCDLELSELDPARFAEQTGQLESFGAVLVAGGDGTFSGLLPYLVGRGIKVGLLPLGTANDLAKEVGVFQLFSRSDPRRLLQELPYMSTKPLAVWRLVWGEGDCGSILFSNYVSFGFEGAAVREFVARRKLEARRRLAGVWLNRLSYVGAGLRSIHSGFVRGAVIRRENGSAIEIGPKPVRSLIFSNIRSMMGLAVSNPHSNPFDDRIEAMTVGGLSDYAVMLARHRLPFFGGKFLGAAARWEISGLAPDVCVQVDGEAVPGLKSAVFSIEPAGEVQLLVARRGAGSIA